MVIIFLPEHPEQFTQAREGLRSFHHHVVKSQFLSNCLFKNCDGSGDDDDDAVFTPSFSVRTCFKSVVRCVSLRPLTHSGDTDTCCVSAEGLSVSVCPSHPLRHTCWFSQRPLWLLASHGQRSATLMWEKLLSSFFRDLLLCPGLLFSPLVLYFSLWRS